MEYGNLIFISPFILYLVSRAFTWHGRKFDLYLNFYFIFGFKSINMACGNFILISIVLYLVSRALTWHAAMFGLGVRQGEFWVNVVTARKAGVAIVHAHKIVQFCANDNNAQLCQIVQTGWGFCTHTLQTLSFCTCHYFSHIRYVIHSIQEGFLWTASD